MVDAPADDSLPMLPADSAPATPSIAEQQRQHAEQQPPPPGDNLPMAPPVKPPIMSSSWSQIGTRLWDEGTRGLGLGTRAVAEGLGGIVGTVGDIATYPGRALGKAIGYQPPPGQDFYTPPSQQIQQAINQTGLPTPQTPTEANTSTIVRGAAAAAPAISAVPALGVAAIPPALRLAAQAGGGAIAGQKAAQSDVVPWYLKPSVDLLISTLAAKGVDVGAGGLGKAANAVAGNMNPTYQAFQRLGMDTNLVGTVSGSEAARSAEAATSQIPFASSVVRPVQQKAVNQFGDAVERTASQLDPIAINAQTTGQTVQQAARDWRDNFYQVQQPQAWAPVNQSLAGTAVTPTGYGKALDDLTTQLGLPETQKALTPAVATKLRDALTADVPAGGSITWEQAQQLRSLIGRTMGVPEIVQSVGMDALKKAYGGISGDMRTTAAANGQDAAFDAANAVSTNGHAFLEGPLSKVISANNPAQETITPEQVTKNLLSSGDTTLQAIRNNMPGAADSLAAYNLRQMATAKPSQAVGYDDTSTGTFLTNYNRLRQQQPGGAAALYSTPAIRQNMDDLSTAAGALRETEQHLNRSGTAQQLGWMQYFQGIAEAAKELKPGKFVGAATLPPATGWGAGNVVTSPLAARFTGAQPIGPSPIPPRVSGLLGSAASPIAPW